MNISELRSEPVSVPIPIPVVDWARADFVSLLRPGEFPIELEPPPGFQPDQLETWPRIVGRLEYCDGRLLYMPPTGADQGETVADIVVALGDWRRYRREFVLRTSEAGMKLSGDMRAADVAVWRKRDLDPRDRGVARVPPVLAVEVAGTQDREKHLAAKAHWYLEVGVEVIWLVFPKDRRVWVITRTDRTLCRPGDTLPSHPSLPGLELEVDSLFQQLPG